MDGDAGAGAFPERPPAALAPGRFAQINVSYQSEPLVGLFVPVEMLERYSSTRRATVVEGTATYGRLRHFQVKTDEELVPAR